MSDKHARGLDAETKSCFMHGDYTGKETCPGCWIDVASVHADALEGIVSRDIESRGADAAPPSRKPMLNVTCADCGGERYSGEQCSCCPASKPAVTPENIPPPIAFRDAFAAMATAAGDDDALRRLSDAADIDKESE
jgi:hypothetical protein